MAAATDPSAMRAMKALAAFLASAAGLLIHGQDVLPPPCRELLQCEQLYPWVASTPGWDNRERMLLISVSCNLSDIHVLLCPSRR